MGYIGEENEEKQRMRKIVMERERWREEGYKLMRGHHQLRMFTVR